MADSPRATGSPDGSPRPILPSKKTKKALKKEITLGEGDESSSITFNPSSDDMPTDLSAESKDDGTPPEKKQKRMEYKQRLKNAIHITHVKRPQWPDDAAETLQEAMSRIKAKYDNASPEDKSEMSDRKLFFEMVVQGGGKNGWVSMSSLADMFPDQFNTEGFTEDSTWSEETAWDFGLPDTLFRGCDAILGVWCKGDEENLMEYGTKSMTFRATSKGTLPNKSFQILARKRDKRRKLAMRIHRQNQQISDAQQRIRGHQELVDTHQKRVDSHQRSIEMHQQFVDENQQTVDTHQKIVDKLQQDVDAMQRSLEHLQGHSVGPSISSIANDL